MWEGFWWAGRSSIVSPESGQRAPDGSSCPHSGVAKQKKRGKRVPSVPLVSRATQPAVRGGRERTSPLSAPLSSSLRAVCSVRHWEVGPHRPGPTAFTCDPHSYRAFWQTARSSANNEVKIAQKERKKEARKQRQTAALIICWELWGHCSAWMPALHWHTLVCAVMWGCRIYYYGNTLPHAHTRMRLFCLFQSSYTCVQAFLSQKVVEEESMVSRGGGGTEQSPGAAQ